MAIMVDQLLTAPNLSAQCAVFVHSGVSDERIPAISRFGAQIVRVEGKYDDSVVEGTRVAAEQNWTLTRRGPATSASRDW